MSELHRVYTEISLIVFNEAYSQESMDCSSWWQHPVPDSKMASASFSWYPEMKLF